MSTGTSWWWLSFVDETKPEGSRFLGAVALEVPADADPILHARAKKLNPGGEVAFFEILPEYLPNLPLDMRNRLLSRQEAESI